MSTIDVNDLKALDSLRQLDTVLFEVLPLSYYEDGHIPGAIQIDLEEIPKMSRKLGLKQSTKIITYCSGETCKNSHQAAGLLQELGFKNVLVYSGGKKDWLARGNQLTK